MRKYNNKIEYEDNIAYVTVYNWPKTFIRITWFCEKIKATRDLNIMFEGFTAKEFLGTYGQLVNEMSTDVLAEMIDAAVLNSNKQSQTIDSDDFYVRMRSSLNSSTYIQEMESGRLVESNNIFQE